MDRRWQLLSYPTFCYWGQPKRQGEKRRWNIHLFDETYWRQVLLYKAHGQIKILTDTLLTRGCFLFAQCMWKIYDAKLYGITKSANQNNFNELNRRPLVNARFAYSNFITDKIHRLRRGVSSSQKISGTTLFFREPFLYQYNLCCLFVCSGHRGRRLPVAIVLRFDRVSRREPSPTGIRIHNVWL